MQSSYELHPLVELTEWSVFQVPIHGKDAPWTQHFVGFSVELGLAQVSSAIVMFDADHGVGASASHRVFQLVGESGRHLESLQLWTRWKTLNGVHLERDITPGFYPAQKALRVGEIA
jgi:hypothetical protein